MIFFSWLEQMFWWLGDWVKEAELENYFQIIFCNIFFFFLEIFA